MNVYPGNYEVAVTVEFTDLNGQPVTPTAIRAKLFDSEDLLVHDFGALAFSAPAGEQEIVIAGTLNVLGVGELSAARVLRVEIDTAAGIVHKSVSYLLRNQARLALMQNSFMTLEHAELLALEVPNLMGWSGASEETKIAALIEAYGRLTKLAVRYSPATVIDQQSLLDPTYATERVITSAHWALMTASDFNLLPAPLRRALRLAQVVEANEMTQGEAYSLRRRNGIVSETIGESSVTFNSGALDAGVSSVALRYLAGFIYYSARIARA